MEAETDPGDELEAWRKQAQQAFARGNYAEVRRLCKAMRAHPEASRVDAEVRDLLTRTGVDPAQVLALAITLLFFAWTVAHYALHLL